MYRCVCAWIFVDDLEEGTFGSDGGELRLLRVLMLVLMLLRGSTGRLRWGFAAIATAPVLLLLRVAGDGGVWRGLIGGNGLIVAEASSTALVVLVLRRRCQLVFSVRFLRGISGVHRRTGRQGLLQWHRLKAVCWSSEKGKRRRNWVK